MKQRVLTAALLAPVALAAAFLTSPLPLLVVSLLLCTLGVMEIARMGGVSRILPVLTLLGVAFPFYAVHIAHNRIYPEFFYPALILFGVAIGTLASASKRGNYSSSVVDVGGLWVAMPMLALAALHELLLPRNVVWRWDTPLLMLLLPVWIGDICGMFAGKALGGRLLAPKLSPKKTLVGSMAILCSSIIAGTLLARPLHEAAACGALCGLAAGTFGQAGDLFESMLKRRAGLKDSGTLLPGHGGVLDRVDSLLFAAIPVAAIVHLYALRPVHADGRDRNPTTQKSIRLDQKGARIVGGDQGAR